MSKRMGSSSSTPVLQFEEVEPVERVAALFYHLAHLPQGCFWPHQVFRTHQEILYSVHLFREHPEYLSWIQLAEMQMCELGLVPGATTSSIRSEEERALVIRPIPASTRAEASEREVASMGDVAEWQARMERLKEILGSVHPSETQALVSSPIISPEPVPSEFINNGRGKGGWSTKSRPRGKGKWTWKRYRDELQAATSKQPESNPTPSRKRKPKATKE